MEKSLGGGLGSAVLAQAGIKHNRPTMLELNAQREAVAERHDNGSVLFTCMFVMGTTSFKHLESTSTAGKQYVTALLDDNVQHVFVRDGSVITYTATENSTKRIIEQTTDRGDLVKHMSTILDKIDSINKPMST